MICSRKMGVFCAKLRKNGQAIFFSDRALIFVKIFFCAVNIGKRIISSPRKRPEVLRGSSLLQAPLEIGY
jgi:hypothetical protein